MYSHSSTQVNQALYLTVCCFGKTNTTNLHCPVLLKSEVTQGGISGCGKMDGKFMVGEE